MGKPLADHLAASHWLGAPSKAQMGGSHESKYVSNPAIKINTQGSSSQFSVFFFHPSGLCWGEEADYTAAHHKTFCADSWGGHFFSQSESFRDPLQYRCKSSCLSWQNLMIIVYETINDTQGGTLNTVTSRERSNHDQVENSEDPHILWCWHLHGLFSWSASKWPPVFNFLYFIEVTLRVIDLVSSSQHNKYRDCIR